MAGWWKYLLTRLGQWLIRILLVTLIISGLIFILYASEALIRTDDFMPVLNPDFTLNLVAEFIGILLTVGVLDRLIAFRKSRDELPARVAALYDFKQVYDDCVLIWYRMLREVLRQQPQYRYLVEGDFDLMDHAFGPLIGQLNLEETDGVFKKGTWRQQIDEESNALLRLIDRTLQRHINHLKPDMIKALQALERTDFFDYTKQLEKGKKIAKETGIELPPTLIWGDTVPPDAFLTAVADMWQLIESEFPHCRSLISDPTKFVRVPDLFVFALKNSDDFDNFVEGLTKKSGQQ